MTDIKEMLMDQGDLLEFNLGKNLRRQKDDDDGENDEFVSEYLKTLKNVDELAEIKESTNEIDSKSNSRRSTNKSSIMEKGGSSIGNSLFKSMKNINKSIKDLDTVSNNPQKNTIGDNEKSEISNVNLF